MVYNSILNSPGQRKIAVLIDPDKQTDASLGELLHICKLYKVSYILTGGSLVSGSTESLVDNIKSQSNIPVVLFPGSLLQLTNKADAIFLLSLISGRNAEYLIGNHVVAAPYLKNSNIEIIPTGYMLIESGKTTSVQYMSNTIPLPADKPELAVATAIAGEMLGLKAIYLEAGSGALNRVPDSIIGAVKSNIKIPLIVGGGIRSSHELAAVFKAGADVVVIGNASENGPQALEKILA